MELWSRLCLLVLAATASTRGQNAAEEKKEGLTSHTTLAPRPWTSEAKSSNISNATSSNVFSAITTVAPEVRNSTTNENVTATISPKSGNASASITTVTVTMSTDTTTLIPGTSEGKSWGSTAGYVVLVLIILVIILLCIILFCLRRASRTYSFDLQRPAPPNHVHLPTFEPIDLDDFEQTTPKALQMTENLHPPPLSSSSSSAIPNGTSQRSDGEGSSDESHTSVKEQLAANVSEVLPNKKVLPTSDNPTELQPDQWSCTDLFFGADDGAVCSSEPFVEVNLEEDAW